MRGISILTVFLVGLAAFLPAYGAEECTADFRVDLTFQENSLLHFKVMVTTDAARAEILYNLFLTVASASGDERVVTKPRVVKIGGGTVNDLATHELEPGQSLVSSEAVLVSCRPLS